MSTFTVNPAGRAFQVGFAREWEELEQAYRLVSTNYMARGYEAASPRLYRFTPFNALPDSTTLVARHDGRIAATFSVVPDNTLLNLPMDALCADDVAGLRALGHRLAEVVSLADSGLGLREFRQVFTALIRLGMQHHADRGGDAYIIAVNPRHQTFYAKVLGFLPLGDPLPATRVCGAPAVGMWGDFRSLAERAPAAHREIFGEPLSTAVLTAPATERAILRRLAADSSVCTIEEVEEVFRYVDRFGPPRRW